MSGLIRRLRRVLVARRDNDGPTTLVGQWISAGVFRENDRRTAMLEKLDAEGWDGADAVAKAAFEIAVREAYGPGWVGAEPEEMAAGMRAHFGADGVDRVPQDAAVRLIRAARGDEVDVDDIPLKVSFTIHSIVFVGLAWDIGYDRATLHAVLRQAEDIARADGARPAPAGDPTP